MPPPSLALPCTTSLHIVWWWWSENPCTYLLNQSEESLPLCASISSEDVSQATCSAKVRTCDRVNENENAISITDQDSMEGYDFYQDVLVGDLSKTPPKVQVMLEFFFWVGWVLSKLAPPKCRSHFEICFSFFLGGGVFANPSWIIQREF